MSEIPDPIELGESQAERWADTHLDGDRFTCECGASVSLDDAVYVYSNPFAPPVCLECAKEY